MKTEIKKVILFASGNGSNVQNIIEYFKNSNGHFPQRMKVLHESSLFQVVNDSV